MPLSDRALGGDIQDARQVLERVPGQIKHLLAINFLADPITPLRAAETELVLEVVGGLDHNYKLFCHTGKCRAVTIRRADIVRARAKIQSASGFAVPTHWASVPYLADQGEPLL